MHFFNVWTIIVQFEYKGMKTVGVTDCTNQTPPKHFGWKKCLSSTPVKMWKYFFKCAQNRRCTSSIFNVWTIIMQSLNIKEWKLFELQITPTIFGRKKCLSSTLVKIEKIFIKCEHNRRCTSSIYGQSLAKFEYKGMKTVGVTDYTN